MDDFTHFSSSDFYVCACLIAFGFHLRQLIPGTGNFTEFVFEESPEDCHQAISSYWAHELKIDARTLISSIHELRSRLKQGV